jgi:hypothetical protein
MGKKCEKIVFIGQVYRIKTLADGGIEATFHLPETAIVQAAEMMEGKRNAVAFRITLEAQSNTLEHD